MTFIVDNVTSTISEVFALIWMELIMVAIASLGYVVFMGRRLPIQQGRKKKGDDEDRPMKESDLVGRELQRKLSAGDHRAVYKLWQRLKSLDTAPHGCLSGVVRAMQQLGKPAPEILAELRSALECNATISESLVDLLEALQREKSSAADDTLITGVINLLEGQKQNCEGSEKDASRRKRLALLAAALRQSKMDDVFTQLEKLQQDVGSIELPDQVAAKLLSLVVRDTQTSEVFPRLLALGVSFNTKTLDDTLREAGRRKDAVMLRQLYVAAGTASIPKGPQTFESLVKGLATDSSTVHALFEEILALQVIPESLALVVISVCGTTQDLKLCRIILEQMQPIGNSVFPSSSAVLAAVARTCVTCELFSEACDLYEAKIASQDAKVDPQTNAALMKAATQAGRASLAQTLLEHGSGNLHEHVTMIKACGRKQDLRGAKQAFDRLKTSGAPLSPLIYNCLLDACIQCSDMNSAEEYFAQMKQLDYADVVSYNTLLKAYLHQHRSSEAQCLLQEMSKQGLPANRVTYNELLNAKVISKDRRGMWKLVEDMKAAGASPNAVTCSILLKALTDHSHTADVSNTMEVLQQMDEPMDEVLFSSVIEACIRIHRLDLLSEMMRKYAQQGGLLALTAPTYGSMIKAYGQAHDVERLWELWNEMSQREVKPTAITLGCMIDALVKNTCVDNAWELLNKMLEDDQLRSLVNTVIYSTILKGFAMSKQIGKVFTVYMEMRKRAVQCNTISYNTMLDACARCSSMDRVPQLLQDMKESKVEPDIITYSTIVKGYCLSGDVDRAFEVLEEMKSDNKFAPDEILYNSLLDGCAKQHRVEEAVKLLEDMKQSGVAPSNFTLSILVKLMGRARRLNQAFALIEELCALHGFRPNIQVYTCLIQACIHNRQMDKALQLHDTMIEEGGCLPDQKLYSVLGRGCLQAGLSQKATKVVRCAYQLPGHSMATPKRGQVAGVENKLLEEVVSALNSGNKTDKETAQELIADLKEHRGINAVQNTVYARIAQQAAWGSPSRNYRSPRKSPANSGSHW
jgi:pentatricopeptide repeat protein